MTPSLADRPARESSEPPARAAWSAIRERARQDLSEASYKLWFAELDAGELSGVVLELIAPSAYVKRWLSGHYMDLITASVRDAIGPGVRVRLRSRPAEREASGAAKQFSPDIHGGAP